MTFLFLQPEGFHELALDQREQRLLAHCLAWLRSLSSLKGVLPLFWLRHVAKDEEKYHTNTQSRSGKEKSNMKEVVLCDKTGRQPAVVGHRYDLYCLSLSDWNEAHRFVKGPAKSLGEP